MRRRQFLATAAATLPALSAQAQPVAFPARPVRLVIPYSGGGVVDVLSRGLARSLATALGPNAAVFVDNKPGGATRIGTMEVANARPDGHSLLVIPPVAWIGYFYSNAYDRKVWRDLTPVAEFASTPYNAIITKAGGGLDTWARVAEKGRRTPGGITAGSPAFGGFVEYAFNAMLQGAGMEGTIVPFRGGGEMMTALLGGQVDFNIIPFADAVSKLRSGECHLLAISSEGRHPLVPEVPSFVELGIGEVLTNTYSVWAPPGLPAPITAQIAAAVRQAMQDPPFVDLMVNRMAFDLEFRSGEVLQADLDALDTLWGPRLQAAFRR
ncbi:tripartite tricarboxylate transporter substrate binding protein [Humitalea sp. 24SJ18S-53]|uniref:tripartite tricarboxylate transporter substrate binding protein n=1 Tax=Humitalea sp. 24SJ18S-53 TaxID=3422307 RepID=UPI003D67D62C